MNGTADALVALGILVGLVGVLVPLLPGLLLVLASVAVWAFTEASGPAWTVLAVATALAVAGWVAKYAVPGRRMAASGVPWTTTAAGVLLAIVGFFVVPVVGAVLGFVLGVYLAERARVGSHVRAWPSTRSAVGAVGLSLLIELATGLLIAGVWVVGLLLGA